MDSFLQSASLEFVDFEHEVMAISETNTTMNGKNDMNFFINVVFLVIDYFVLNYIISC